MQDLVFSSPPSFRVSDPIIQCQVLSNDDSPLATRAFCAWAQPGGIPTEFRTAANKLDIDRGSRFLRVENTATASRERRALQFDIPAQGGYLEPSASQGTYLSRLQDSDATARAGTLLNDDGHGKLLIGLSNDVANEGSLQVPETGTISTTAQPSFSQVTLFGDREYNSGRFVCSNRLDRLPQFGALVQSEAGARNGRIQGRHHILGTPSGPKGLLNETELGATAVAAAGVDSDDLFTLVESIDPSYRLNGSFLMKSATFNNICKLKDGNGLPKLPYTAGRFPTLLGFPVYLSPYMPAAATTVKSVLFGDFQFYYVRQSGVIYEKFVELYAAQNCVAYTAIQYCDAALVDLGAIKHLLHP